jgi:hypothetical protein
MDTLVQSSNSEMMGFLNLFNEFYARDTMKRSTNWKSQTTKPLKRLKRRTIPAIRKQVITAMSVCGLRSWAYPPPHVWGLAFTANAEK